MRVFVTGGLGFTGAALVERLLEHGHTVSVLDTHPGLRREALEAAGAEVMLGSITDPEGTTAPGRAGGNKNNSNNLKSRESKASSGSAAGTPKSPSMGN